MGARLRSRPPAAVALVGFAALAASMVGYVLAASLPKGLAGLVGLAYLPLVVFNLPVAAAAYVALIFLAGLPLTGLAPSVAGVLILAAWAGALPERAATARAHRLLTPAFAALVVWIGVSLTWATDPATGLSLLFPQMLVAVLAFVVIASFVRTERQHLLLAGGYVTGAVLSVIVAFAQHGLETARTATQTAEQVDQGRLAAGSGDPNYLAAGLIPALVIAAGLLPRVRDPIARLVMLVGIAILPAGLAATQSRGALVATGVTIIAALVVARRHRAHVLAFVVALLACAGTWLAANPAAAQRIVNFNDGGAGRSDLWNVGWRMWQDHPVSGVGFGNFEVLAPQYTRRAGQLKYVELVAERPHVTHNLYLQYLADTGVVGLALWLSVVAGCLAASMRAARIFARRGLRRLELHARLTLIAQIGFLSASFFLSNGSDERLWILLAFGPGLLAIARRPVVE